MNTEKEGYRNIPSPPEPTTQEYNNFNPNPQYNPPNYYSNDDSSSIVFLVEEIPRVQEDDVSIMVIYMCAIFALFIPLIGFIYLCCFRFCCWNGKYGPRKRTAFKTLIITTFIGFLFDIIFGSLLGDGKIKLN